ncbi:cell division/cell wall cluster transcriptional repressor MraZ [Candidatus Endobugula sertula]|uniref:Transcriptional regulator MraZ n=1 Tax=Candidatus Endobugula sertula TaxID=62101 RepID=A0A1D2QTR9_9GAMM|nr:cell division/cell wall cluster transcriptional repressor MraZ [Candidatus Endobugula sertula]
MYYGSHSINMDAKGRIAIPTRVRDLLQESCAGRMVVTAHTENRCLHVFPEHEWQEILPKVEALPSFNKISRRVKLLLIGHASPLELDGNGRVLLPPTLREYASLEKKLMLVGQGKSMELWCEKKFSQYIDSPIDDGLMPEGMQNLAL